MKLRVNLLLTALLFLMLQACEPAPKDILIGHDECAYCRMIISDKPFGSQIVSTTGKTWFFDSVECLAAYELDHRIEQERIHSRWVPDFENPDNWVNAWHARFLYSEELRSPMGLNLSAYQSETDAERNREAYGGELKAWRGVLELVNEAWLDGNGTLPETN
ncbi:MAG: nitrous oxide reductase accessory protein NosL [Balneolales bacterium]|nr:nitrous oxide reductase accessory protein NosL [Balneolales bacterium]